MLLLQHFGSALRSMCRTGLHLLAQSTQYITATQTWLRPLWPWFHRARLLRNLKFTCFSLILTFESILRGPSYVLSELRSPVTAASTIEWHPGQLELHPRTHDSMQVCVIPLWYIYIYINIYIYIYTLICICIYLHFICIYIYIERGMIQTCEQG